MKFADVKDLSKVELVKKMNAKKTELFELTMKAHMGNLLTLFRLEHLEESLLKCSQLSKKKKLLRKRRLNYERNYCTN